MSRSPGFDAMSRDPVFRVGLATVVVAAVALVVATTGAVRLESVAAAPPPAAIADSALTFAAVGTGADVAAAVAHDLFQDDRTAPARRYRMPGEADVAVRQPSARPLVLGTAIATDGGSDFAICQVGAAQSQIVRPGGRIGEFTVLSIERNRVWFRSADGERFPVDASKPVP